MNRIKKMMTKIENVMSAITFAEAGEFDAAREIINRNRKVLLGIKNADINALRYAVNICRRIDADLDILLITGSENAGYGSELLKRFKSELDKTDIHYEITLKSGDLRKEIVDCTMNRGEILFVVVGSSAEIDLELNKPGSRLSTSLEKLKCPLVVVTGHRMPVAV